MHRRWIGGRAAAAWALLWLGLSGCGFTVGDSCTTSSQCGGEVCIQRSELPGGYCSLACASDAQCPSGSLCVGDGPGAASHCYLGCTRDGDCRQGYQCNQAHQRPALVCVGTAF